MPKSARTACSLSAALTVALALSALAAPAGAQTPRPVPVTPPAQATPVRQLYFHRDGSLLLTPPPVVPVHLAAKRAEVLGTTPLPAARLAEPTQAKHTDGVGRPDVIRTGGADDFDFQRNAENDKKYVIQLDPPGLERVTRLDSEQTLERRIQQEARQRAAPERVAFPDKPLLAKAAFNGRLFAANTLRVEPMYVNYQRLYFEEKNSERYGWDFGIIGPLVSTGMFWKDTLFYPLHVGTDPCRKFESSAGECLPGDPVPQLWYPPELSVTGALWEAGVVIGLVAIFP